MNSSPPQYSINNSNNTKEQKNDSNKSNNSNITSNNKFSSFNNIQISSNDSNDNFNQGISYSYISNNKLLKPKDNFQISNINYYNNKYSNIKYKWPIAIKVFLL